MKRRTYISITFLGVCIAALIIVLTVAGHTGNKDSAGNRAEVSNEVTALASEKQVGSGSGEGEQNRIAADDAGNQNGEDSGQDGTQNAGSAGQEGAQNTDSSGENGTQNETASSQNGTGNQGAPDGQSKKPQEETKKLSLFAVGDNLAHIDIVEHSYDPESGIFDFTPIYEKVKDKISSYDLSVVNQETILVNDPDQRSGFPLFATPNTMGDAIADAGFDLILSANNHCYDCGAWGIEETLQFWREKHPKTQVIGLYSQQDSPDGTEPPYVSYREQNGIHLALFNLTAETNDLELPPEYTGGTFLLNNPEKLIGELQEAENTQDFSIVFLHFGEEYSTEPYDGQRQLVAELTNAGADLFICSHPHVLQGVETVVTESGAQSVVYWSLGNFLSHQVDPITVLEGAASVMIEKKPGQKAEITSYDLLPMICHFDGYGTTQIYFLDDYSDDLAYDHFINSGDILFTKESLMERYNQIMGE